MKKFHSKLSLCAAAIFLLIAVTSWGQTSQATIYEDWTNSAGTQHFFQKSVTKTDGSGNSYIAGATVNSNGNYDVLVAKYSRSGTLVWMNQYAGSAGGNDFASALYIDGSSNVYITGSVLNTASDSNDVLTIKWNSSGTQQWVATYHGGTGNDGGADLVVDGSGNVFVTGSSNQGSTNKFDVVTIKYNSSGTQQWVGLYDYNNLNDGGYKITLNGSKSVVAAGVQSSSTDYRQATFDYNGSGTQGTPTVSSSSGIGFAMVYAITTDASKNVYVTGSKTNTGVGLDCYTVKYDSTLAVVWTATYNGSASGNDESKSIAVDGSGNVYIAGYATVSGQSTNYVTIKYNSSGTQQWVKLVNDDYNGHDEGTALCLDNNGIPIVTGFIWNGATNDYYTIKYDGSGNTVWQIRFGSVADGNDKALDCAVDLDGGVFVVGQTGVPGALTYTVVKYTQKNAIYPPDGMAISNTWAFVQNRGQVLGTDGNHFDTLKYYNVETPQRTYFSDKTVSYVFCKKADTIIDPDTLTRVIMNYKGGNTDRLIRAFDPRTDFYNYFGAGTPAGAVHVPLFKRLVSYDVYTKIDVEYTQNSNGLVAYYIVRPGGSPSNIQMTYSGQNSISINGSGDLVVSTVAGSMAMPKATAFQIDNSGNYVSLAWQPSYSLTSSTVSFTSLGTYNSSYTLVFRVYMGPPSSPTSNANGNMWWSTHYGGGSGDDLGLDVCNDNIGNTYVAGYTYDQNFPHTTIVSWRGGQTDGVVLKFDDGAQRKWVTFYGGNSSGGGGFDIIRSITFNYGVHSGHLYFCGYTESDGQNVSTSTFPIIPTTNPNNGSYWQSTNYTANSSPGRDAFIARMDTTDGSVSWSQFFGGRDVDDGICIKTAPNGRMFFCGNTASQLADVQTCNHPSNSYFPLCHSFSSSYIDSTYNGGSTNAFVALFDTTNTLRWSTYLGSAATVYDAVYNDGLNSFFVVGSTQGSVPSVYQTGEYHMGTYSNQTSTKGFVTRFDNSGQIEWSTCINRVSAIQTVTNISKELLIVGITNSTDTAVITTADTSAGYAICGTGYRDQVISGTADYYVMNFSPQNQLRWSTFFGGGTGEDAPLARQPYSISKYVDAVADTNGNVFILGATDNFGSPPFTTLNQYPMYWQSAWAGGNNAASDLVLFGFRANRSLIWSTYCGGDYPLTSFGDLEWASDLGGQISYSVATNKIYFAGSTGSITYPYICPSTSNPYCYNPSIGGAAPMDIFVTCLNMQTINVGVSEPNVHDNGQLSVFPNPATNDFTVVIPEYGKEKSTILVYNTLGQIVATQVLEPGEYQTTFKTETWADGVYEVQVIQGNQTFSKKVIVQH